MRPGDLLYIPRGVYHDAVALTEGTIHVAFGATAVIGLDFLTALFERAIRDPLARANMPRLSGPGGEAAYDEHLAKLAHRLGEIGGEPEMIGKFKEHQRRYGYSRGGYALPGETAAAGYRVTAKGCKVAAEGNGFALKGSGGTVPIPPGQDKPVAWVIGRDRFTRAEFDAAFPQTPAPERARLLRDLAAMKVITAL